MRDIDLQVSRGLLRGSKVVTKTIQSILKSVPDAKKLASARTVWNLRRACLAPCRKNVSQNRLRAGSIVFVMTLGWSWATLFTVLPRNEYPSAKTDYKSWSSSYLEVKYRPNLVNTVRNLSKRYPMLVYDSQRLFSSPWANIKVTNNWISGGVERSSATELPVYP